MSPYEPAQGARGACICTWTAWTCICAWSVEHAQETAARENQASAMTDPTKRPRWFSQIAVSTRVAGAVQVSRRCRCTPGAHQVQMDAGALPCPAPASSSSSSSMCSGFRRFISPLLLPLLV